MYFVQRYSSVRLFADDTSLIVENPVEAANQLNSDLSKIYQWATKWSVKFNPAKSESVIFSRNTTNHTSPLLLNQKQVNEVTSHKHLGLVFSNDCSWHEHLDYIKAKAWSRTNIMRKLKFKLDRLYFSFIRPPLEYADVVLDNCTQYEVNDLKKIQKRSYSSHWCH